MEKLSTVKAILIDLSGTIHVDTQAIKGELNQLNQLTIWKFELTIRLLSL